MLVASNGNEALQIWHDHQHEIDLMLSDMILPEGMTGLDLADQMKTEKPNLKIVLSSGYEPHASLQHQQLFDVYLPKPYLIDKLPDVIRKCFNRK